MTNISRLRAITLPLAASLIGCALLPFRAGAQTVAPSPAGMAYTDSKGRHLAPRGTFYLLSYVSATTKDGVEGFDPGQEVHLVEAHHATHTLVVSDGRAQVEVSPSKLTNDLDIAALARQKDAAKQARIAAYIQAEETAYNKAEQVAATATARDLQKHTQQQAAEARAIEQAQAEPTPQPTVAAAAAPDNYYGEGGYGYGSPYSYLVVEPERDRPKASAPAAVAPAANEGRVVAPQPPAGGVRPK